MPTRKQLLLCLAGAVSTVTTRSSSGQQALAAAAGPGHIRKTGATQ